MRPIAPIFCYFDVFDAIADTEVFAGTPKVRAWRTALAARPSVANAVPADYADRLRAFLSDRDAHLLKIAA
jgi:glutathione S-transferase